MALTCIIHMAMHHTNYLISTTHMNNFPWQTLLWQHPYKLNLIKTYHLTLTEETVEEFLGEFTLAIALGKYCLYGAIIT